MSEVRMFRGRPVQCDWSTDWQVSAQAYLARLGAAEYAAAVRVHRKAKRSRSALPSHVTPSAYMSELVDLLGANDEEGFKARKMLEGYASELGV